MCVCVCVCNHENNVPPGYHRNGFVATHALGHMMHIIFMIAHIYCTHLAFVRFEHYVCRGSLMITYGSLFF